MASSKSSLAMFALAIVMAVVADVSAQNTPQDFVNLHNRARAVDGVGPVAWDNNVARFAQDWAAQRAGDCRLQHSGGPFGENIFWGSGQSWTAATRVNGSGTRGFGWRSKDGVDVAHQRWDLVTDGSPYCPLVVTSDTIVYGLSLVD
uniref:Pathogenesis-related protein PRMS n=1 Tax=Aegilops tauschii TaxID=37682 RepID=M8BRX1_AEGTA